jgi:hypothetical protein
MSEQVTRTLLWDYCVVETNNRGSLLNSIRIGFAIIFVKKTEYRGVTVLWESRRFFVYSADEGLNLPGGD